MPKSAKRAIGDKKYFHSCRISAIFNLKDYVLETKLLIGEWTVKYGTL